MTIEEAVVYAIVSSRHGLKAEQIAQVINDRRLHVRKDGQPVSVKQVWFVVKSHPETFCFAEGRVMLLI